MPHIYSLSQTITNLHLRKFQHYLENVLIIKKVSFKSPWFNPLINFKPSVIVISYLFPSGPYTFNLRGIDFLRVGHAWQAARRTQL